MCITVNKAVKRVKNFWFYGAFTKKQDSLQKKCSVRKSIDNMPSYL